MAPERRTAGKAKDAPGKLLWHPLCSPLGAGIVPVGARRQRVSQLCGGAQEGGDTLGGEGDSVAKAAKPSPKVAPC